jgi:hypothetical protein
MLREDVVVYVFGRRVGGGRGGAARSDEARCVAKMSVLTFSSAGASLFCEVSQKHHYQY